MAKIPQQLVEEVRERINIIDVVSPYVQLKKQGRNLFGKCPFHEERTPSFSVNEEKQIFHCFSCGRGGNAFSFLMEIENMSFPQAVAKLAPQAGVAIDDSYLNNQTNVQVDSETKALRDLYAEATRLYHHLLVNTDSGEQALAYLTARGLDESTIDAFMLGYAPEGNILYEYFQTQKIDYQLLRKSELFVEWSDGSLHDRFTERVLFTIRDSSGHPIAFSGRKLTSDDDVPKYVNSPESPLFNKSSELFNLDLAKDTIKKQKTVILFEGFMDVIAAFQSGIANGVASMGTSLTIEQVQQLSRLADKISITYDSDMAGQKATKRALDLIAQHSRLSAQVIHIPDNQDPDEYLRSNDADAFKQVLTHNIEDPVTFNLRYLQIDRNLNNQTEFFTYISDALAVIATVEEPVIRERFLRQVANEFDLSYEALQDQIRPLLLQRQARQPSKHQHDQQQKEISSSSQVYTSNVTVKRNVSRIEKAEQILFAWMLHDNDVWLQVTNYVGFSFQDVSYETLFMIAMAYREEYQQEPINDMAAFMDYVQKPELTRILASLAEIDPQLFTDREQVLAYINVINNEAPLEEKIRQLSRNIKEANRLQDHGRVAQLSVAYLAALKEKQNKNTKH
ncbi:DNA primase [Weissella hellenica]|uniref:DNA primase n=1 Tax=Weissella hellenica TaxID=46256 RepID=A0A4Y4G0D8_WEIHE|nr:DNA primase [Weissella hellenica]NKY66573.1 DNA primase [Weissella hellenica]GED35247.1 DNA primase [Weissella hellenica]SCB81915.1 DNA primase [Weissella hellenica]